MDGWGSLTMLIKRQEAAKNRKATLKYELQKRRESLINDNHSKKLEFPEISNIEMEIIKEKIRAEYKVAKIKSSIVNVLLLLFVIFLFYYIFSNKK